MDGKASNRVLRLDLDNLSAGWQDVKPFPGMVRIQPVAGSMGDNHFCLFGGFALQGMVKKRNWRWMDAYMTRQQMNGR